MGMFELLLWLLFWIRISERIGHAGAQPLSSKETPLKDHRALAPGRPQG